MEMESLASVPMDSLAPFVRQISMTVPQILAEMVELALTLWMITNAIVMLALLARIVSTMSMTARPILVPMEALAMMPSMTLSALANLVSLEKTAPKKSMNVPVILACMDSASTKSMTLNANVCLVIQANIAMSYQMETS